MKRLLLLAAALVLGAGAAAAQNVSRPDCIIDITLTAAGQTAGGQGTCGFNTNGVYEWRLNYKSSGFTAVSLVVQSAPPDVNGQCLIPTWVAFAGTVTGANPNTATTQASTNFVGFYPCVRVSLTSVMGAGTITGQLYGCREPGCSIAGASIVAAVPQPLQVDGPTAAGAAPTTPPVLVAGQDGAPGVIRTLKTDANGQPIIIDGQTANSTATWNSATALNSAVSVNVAGYANVAFGISSTGVISSGVISFEGSTDGATFVPVSAVAIGFTNNGTTSVTLPASNNIWQMYVGGLTQFRLRLSTVITGAGTESLTLAATVAPAEFQQVVAQASGLNLHVNADVLPGATTAQADAQTNSPMQPVASVAGTATKTPNYPYKFNGATWDRDFVCPLSAPITFSAASGSLQIVGLVAAQIIRVCHISISSSAATNFTLQYGTGANCAVGTTALSGAYNNVTTLALDLFGTLRTPASQELCINSSASITAGGMVTYAQF